MQVFGVRDNFSSAPLTGSVPPLASRIFTKLESCVWNHGSLSIPFVPDMTGEIEIVARVESAIDGPAQRHSGSPSISYAIGIDFGSSQTGKLDGQWWRSKGARGYAPLGAFVEGNMMENLHGHALNVTVNGDTDTLSLDGMRNTPEEIVSHISEHCNLYAGDLIFLGALSFVRDFSVNKDITVASNLLPEFRLISAPSPDGYIKLSILSGGVHGEA